MFNRSSSGTLGLVAQCQEFLDKQVSMFALNFNHAVFDCATSAAFSFELFGEFLQAFVVHGQARNQSHALAFSAFGFSGDAHMAVAKWMPRVLAARAV